MTGKAQGRRGRWIAGTVLALVLAGGGLVYLRRPGPGGPVESTDTWVAPPPQVAPTLAQRWRQAAKEVEEERGEPTGRSARPAIPPELRHYSNTRRFLAVQVAGWMEEDFELPHDDAALARMIGEGALVEVEPVGDTHVLYGVGANASSGPLTHWDARTGREVRLFPDWGAFDDARAVAREEIEAAGEDVKAAQAELRKLTRKQRTRRNAVNKQIRAARAKLSALQRDLALASSYWDDYDRRRTLVAEWNAIAERAAAFPERRYDLRVPGERRALRARMLSFVRPTARDVMMDLARAYHGRFGRPLAITSLYRTLHYQRQLGEVNANATRIDVPPHGTGLAFDIYYRYMTAEEQSFVMDQIATMKKAARVEALRELRDHFHVFAFADGSRPGERLIAQALREVGPGAVRAASRPRSARVAAQKPSSATKRTRASAPKRTAKKPVRRAPAKKKPVGRR